MIIRSAKREDWDDIVEISNKRNIPLPEFKNVLGTWVVEEEGKVISFAYLLKMVELVFSPDPSLGKKDLVKSLKLMQGSLEKESMAYGIDQVHCAVLGNESFVGILMEHFGYSPCNGTMLYYNIPNGEK